MYGSLGCVQPCLPLPLHLSLAEDPTSLPSRQQGVGVPQVSVVQWSPSITDTTGTKDFVLYSEVSFAQGVIIDHPLTIMASYAGARLWTMKSVVLMKDLLIFSS